MSGWVGEIGSVRAADLGGVVSVGAGAPATLALLGTDLPLAAGDTFGGIGPLARRLDALPSGCRGG